MRYAVALGLILAVGAAMLPATANHITEPTAPIVDYTLDPENYAVDHHADCSTGTTVMDSRIERMRRSSWQDA